MRKLTVTAKNWRLSVLHPAWVVVSWSSSSGTREQFVELASPQHNNMEPVPTDKKRHIPRHWICSKYLLHQPEYNIWIYWKLFDMRTCAFLSCILFYNRNKNGGNGTITEINVLNEKIALDHLVTKSMWQDESPYIYSGIGNSRVYIVR